MTIHPKPLLMGIINVTPDSFADGGKYNTTTKAIAHGLQLIKDGADILDIGGESTRPGAIPVSPEEEISRVVPVIEQLKNKGAQISIDTRHVQTMQAALQAGADIINDVTALLHDQDSIRVVAQSKKPVVLMHMQGTPQTMQENPTYENVITDIDNFFTQRIDACVAAGVKKENIILDPGIGFGKNLDHNLEILHNLSYFQHHGCRVLLGASRKSFIAQASLNEPAEDRLPGSLAAAMVGVAQNMDILRVHDVKQTAQAIKLWKKIHQTPIIGKNLKKAG